MAKRHVVELTDDERAALEQQEAGPLTRRQRNRVQILLRADAGDTDEEIADEARRLDRHRGQRPPPVRRRRARRRPERPAPPRGRARARRQGRGDRHRHWPAAPSPRAGPTWTARMLANRLVELQVVESRLARTRSSGSSKK